MLKGLKKTLCAALSGLLVHAALLSSLAVDWCPGATTVHVDFASPVHDHVVTDVATAPATGPAFSTHPTPVKQSCGIHHRLTCETTLQSAAPWGLIPASVAWQLPDVDVVVGVFPPPTPVGSSSLRHLRTIVLLI